RLSQDAILRSVYGVSLSANGRATGIKAFQQLGYNAAEAAQMADLSVAIAGKAGSADRFVSRRGGAGLRSTSSGTWEGSSNGTWEGSSITARPGTAGSVTLAPNTAVGAKVVGPTTGVGQAQPKTAGGGR